MYEVTDGFYKMHRDMYWSAIKNRKSPLRVKFHAIKSLWIMRKIEKAGGK